MALDDPEHLKELFSEFGPIATRRMFGGVGVYAEGVMIALVGYGDLYFKADEQNAPPFRAEGAKPFVYSAKGKPVALSYWRLPDRLLDDPEELARWARAALAAAQRAALPRSPRRKRAGPVRSAPRR